MQEYNVVINVDSSFFTYAKRIVRNLIAKNSDLVKLNISLNKRMLENDYFYAINEISKNNNGDEVFNITISSITPLKLLKSVLAIELFKALLYFCNPAVKAFRRRAGEIFYNKSNDIVERVVYAKLVDTVENCAVAIIKPWISEGFLNIYLDEEVYDTPLDYMLSQAMIAPLYATGLVQPQLDLDNLEPLTLLLSTYSVEIVENPAEKTGLTLADELYSLAKIIINDYDAELS